MDGINRPWWPSGLIHHVSNSSRDRQLGPRFESSLGHGTIYRNINNGPAAVDCDMKLPKWLSEK